MEILLSAEPPAAFTALSRKYIRPVRTPYERPLRYMRWMLTLPFHSRRGAALIARHVQGPAPAIWAEEMAGQRVLIVGTGPSLDKVDQTFFAGFDTIIYLNFALRFTRGGGREYFFTTDIGPVRQFLDAYEDGAFHALGPEHCVFAPVFLDQYQMIRPAGRALFTWLRFDAAGWRNRPVRLGPIKLPLIMRYYPRQPDWDRFVLPPAGRTLPVLDHTSALTAVLFAAMNGAAEIGLIGCDFSAGRAASVVDAQGSLAASVFSGAVPELQGMTAALARSNITVTNHSWLV